MSTLHPPKTSSESGRPSIAQVVDKLEMELPPLESKQPFTHTSRYGATKQAFEVPEGSMCYDNETLEHYGDALVNWTASKLIKSLYPRLVPGSSTLLRTTLICNDTLALLSDHFGLPSRLRAALGQMEDLKKNPKVKANLFEAYVCGVWDEYGEKEAVGWLEGVFEPIARNEYGRMKGAQDPTTRLAQQLSASQISQYPPSYISSTSTPHDYTAPHTPSTFTAFVPSPAPASPPAWTESTSMEAQLKMGLGGRTGQSSAGSGGFGGERGTSTSVAPEPQPTSPPAPSPAPAAVPPLEATTSTPLPPTTTHFEYPGKNYVGALLEWTQKDLANRVFQEIPTPPRQGAQFYRLKYGHKDRLKEVEAYETNKKVAKQAAAYQACVDLNIVPR